MEVTFKRENVIRFQLKIKKNINKIFYLINNITEEEERQHLCHDHSLRAETKHLVINIVVLLLSHIYHHSEAKE